MATRDDQLVRRLAARFRQHEAGLLSDEELGNLVVIELTRYRGFQSVEEFVARLPPAAAAAALRFAEEIAAPGLVGAAVGAWAGPDAGAARAGIGGDQAGGRSGAACARGEAVAARSNRGRTALMAIRVEKRISRYSLNVRSSAVPGTFFHVRLWCGLTRSSSISPRRGRDRSGSCPPRRGECSAGSPASLAVHRSSPSRRRP